MFKSMVAATGEHKIRRAHLSIEMPWLGFDEMEYVQEASWSLPVSNLEVAGIAQCQ